MIWRASERAGLQVAVDPEWGWEAIAAQVGPILGWYSPRLGEKQATTTLRGLRRTWLRDTISCCRPPVEANGNEIHGNIETTATAG